MSRTTEEPRGQTLTVEWAPIGYYCTYTGRLYKHRETGASHHDAECCRPLVFKSEIDRLRAAVIPIVQRGQEAHEWNEKYPGAVQREAVPVALETIDRLAEVLRD